MCLLVNSVLEREPAAELERRGPLSSRGGGSFKSCLLRFRLHLETNISLETRCCFLSSNTDCLHRVYILRRFVSVNHDTTWKLHRLLCLSVKAALLPNPVPRRNPAGLCSSSSCAGLVVFAVLHGCQITYVIGSRSAMWTAATQKVRAGPETSAILTLHYLDFWSIWSKISFIKIHQLQQNQVLGWFIFKLNPHRLRGCDFLEKRF